MASRPEHEPIEPGRIYHPLALDGWYEPFYDLAMKKAGKELTFRDPEGIGYNLINEAEFAQYRRAGLLGGFTMTQAEVQAIAGGEADVEVYDVGLKQYGDGYFLTLTAEPLDALQTERFKMKKFISDKISGTLPHFTTDFGIVIAESANPRLPSGLPTSLGELAPLVHHLKPAIVIE